MTDEINNVLPIPPPQPMPPEPPYEPLPSPEPTEPPVFTPPVTPPYEPPAPAPRYETTQVVVFSQPSGYVAVSYPTGEVPIDVVLAAAPLPGSVDATVMEASALPADPELFGAWKLVDGEVIVDPVKAAEIAEDAIAAEGMTLLTAADLKARIGLLTPGQVHQYEHKIIQARHDAHVAPDIATLVFVLRAFRAWLATVS